MAMPTILVALSCLSLGGSAFTVPSRFTNHGQTRPLCWKTGALSSTSAETTALTSAKSFQSTLEFPVSFAELMVLQPGTYVETDAFSIDSHPFRVKLFPKGASSRPLQRSNFGMSYKVPSLFDSKSPQKVQVFLESLNNTQPLDVSFGLRLLGNQTTGPKFDVEWRAAMRFCDTTALHKGQASDFGSSLMETARLSEFLGVNDDNHFDSSHRIRIRVDLQLHEPPTQSESNDTNGKGKEWLGDLRKLPLNDATNNDQHDPEAVRAGKVVVPVLQSIRQRQEMFNNGVYPGVEYRIMRITSNDTDVFYSQKNADYHLRPIYPLVQQLERPWPVVVSEEDIPKIITTNQYNVISAVASLATAISGLLTAFVLSQAVSFYYIPSRSMEPTLNVGDVLLVEKITPKLLHSYNVDDVVLFQPPESLQEIVKNTGGRISSRDLFVKRIGAQPGDVVKVQTDGRVSVNDQKRRSVSCTETPLISQYITTAYQTTVPSGTEFVLGDCSSVSVDSRVWGSLDESNIKGKPILRLWPLSKFGMLPSL